MARSREKLIADLDAAHIGYEDEMSNKELADLLKKAEKAEEIYKAEEIDKAEIKKAEKPISTDYTMVRCGISTIHDHEGRLRNVECMLGIKDWD